VTFVRPLVAVGIAVAAALAGSVLPLAAQTTGVYTAAQATQGAMIFAAQCATCHGAKLEGGAGPQLAGDDFIAKWSGQTADDVHYVVSTQMPMTNPGSLSPAEALAVLAYILQQNHYPAGPTALDAATLKTVKIAKH